MSFVAVVVPPAKAGSGRKINRLIGTTEVVPCYKALHRTTLSGACEAGSNIRWSNQRRS